MRTVPDSKEATETIAITDLKIDDGRRYALSQGPRVLAGSYGMVVKVVDTTLTKAPSLPVFRAVKLLRQEHVNKEKPVKDFFDEIAILSRFQHPNLSRIYDSGFATYRVGNRLCKVPYYAMEWVEGESLDALLKRERPVSSDIFCELLHQMLGALTFLHSQKSKIIHLDIKPDNILIMPLRGYRSAGHRFILTDFGKAKLLEQTDRQVVAPEDPSQATSMGGRIHSFVHPELKPFIRTNQVPKSFFREMGWRCDLYSLSVVLDISMQKVSWTRGSERLPALLQYFLNDLRGYDKNDVELRPVKKYRDTSAFTAEALRLSGVERSSFESPMATDTQVVRLQGRLTVGLPPVTQALIDTPEFQRLRGVGQLAYTHLVFPSATHTRFSHSLGCFYYANRFVEALSDDPLFRYLYDKDDIAGLLCAALLHDVGHYPNAHYFEELSGMKIKVHHQAVTLKILQGRLRYSSFLKAPWAKRFLPRRAGSLRRARAMKCLSDVLREEGNLEIIEKIIRGTGKYKLLNTIINGPFDADKIDYISRDAVASGVPYASSVDLDRFFNSLILDDRKPYTPSIAVTSKGRSAVESIIGSRYNLFTEVYWHKTARSAVSMAKEALWQARFTPRDQRDFDLAAIGLGDRDFMIWLGERIPNHEAASDLVFDGLCLLNRRSLYRRVKTFSNIWKGDATYGKICDKLGHAYSRTADFRHRLVEGLNAYGKKSGRWRKLLDHHVLVDVPINKQDQHKSLIVKYPSLSGEGDPTYNSMNEVSALAEAIYESFSDHTKKVRIFVHPEMRVQVEKLGEAFDRAITESLEGFD